MKAFAVAGLAAIRRTFEEDVVYTGAGLAGATIKAIWSEDAAPEFLGPGSTARIVSFEIADAALPTAPRKGNTIVRVATGETWKVNDITRRDDVAAWSLIVEK